jgi:hypothetical protein
MTLAKITKYVQGILRINPRLYGEIVIRFQDGRAVLFSTTQTMKADDIKINEVATMSPRVGEEND